MTPDPREPEDRDLRERFGALRRRERNETAPFADVLGQARSAAGRPSRRKPPRLVWATGIALLAVLLLLVARGPTGPGANELPVWAAGPWAVPTDVLLETPGFDLLRGFPALPAPSIAPEEVEGSVRHRRTLS